MSGRNHGGDKGRRASKRERRRDRQRERTPVAPTPAVAAVRIPSFQIDGAARLLGPVLVALTGIVMVAWTWRTWPDVIVDFGREIYLAWRLADGDTLYVDARHFSGPLSPYLNALWFRLFGPGVMTLAMANLALAAGLVALVYWLLVRVAGRVAATGGCVYFIATFGCAQYTVVGNYNWICPYSHELTHGVMLAVVGLACVARYQDVRRLRWVGLAGLAAGLVVLTKVETIVAGIPAIMVAMTLTVVSEAPPGRRTAAIVAVFVAAMALPLVATYLWFAPVMTPEEILAWPLGHWHAVRRTGVAASTFYRKGLGIDDVPGNVGTLGVASCGWLGVVGAAVLVGRSGLRHPLAVVACFAAAVGVGRLLSPYQWADTAMRPLSIVVALVAIGGVVEFARHRREPAAAEFALRTALAVFALGMLAKMALNVRIYHYGFALAAPAGVAAVAVLVGWLPAAVARRGGYAPIVRAVILGFLAAAMSRYVTTTKTRMDPKVHVVGAGRDAFYAAGRGVTVERLLQAMSARVGRDDTVVVFPEGAFVNYLGRYRNSTPFYLFDRTTLELWGADAAAAALVAHPPDWVVVVDRGLGGLSAPAVFDWITANYRPVWQLGSPDFTSTRFSVMLMARDAAAPSS